MVRACWFLKVSLMALIAIGVDELIVSVDVTGLTRGRDVFSRERKFCRRVVERSRRPAVHGVARRAGC